MSRTADPGPATRTVLTAVVAATAARSTAGSPDPGIDASIVPDGIDLVAAAVHERLTGPLLWCASRGLVDLDDLVLDRLGAAHVDALAWCLQVESRLWSILGWCAERGIRPLVVKGPAVAHLDEGDPAMRTFADLDLLVRADDLPVLLGTLAARGAVRPFTERRAGFDQRFAKSVTLTFPDHVEVDVHRTICDGVHAVRVPIERLHRDPDAFELGGRVVHAPDRTARTLHAAYHAVLGSSSPRLLSVRDLIGYLGTAEAGDAVGEITEEAARWDGTAVLAQAVREALVPGVDLPAWRDWLDRTVVTGDERAIVAAQRRDGSSFRRSRLAAARELPTRRDRVAYLTAAALPSTRHLRSRGRSRLDALRPGAPTGLEPVILPDLLPPSIDRGDRPRTLVVCPTVATVEAVPADVASADRSAPPVHLVVRSGGDRLRERWWQDGRPATVVELPAGPGWHRRLRRAAVASGELRRFDPDRVVVDRHSIALLAPALLIGRRRLVVVTGGSPSPPDVVTRAALAVVRLRHDRQPPDRQPPDRQPPGR